ncbi:hypothetical protein SASPL_132584 [Salvia splendens]|uniref:Large subunit ribosomal protein L14 n=1 Tax=Salvia splendens TaxID=180675 RepID=A0A8X8X3A3_SALSN|nr:hypothetical protein SASPL_132584 [Salvia splendens]
MAASNSSKLFRVGRSILGGLSNNALRASMPSSHLADMDFLSQLNSLVNIVPEDLMCYKKNNVGEFDYMTNGYISLQQTRTFIQMRTNLKVVDNSGAKRVMCIQALKGKKGARLGDVIVASVKEAHVGGKVKKGDVHYAVVVRAAMPRGRCDGSEVKFDDNAVVLINKQGEPIGTRVFGPVPHELRKKKHLKILSLAEQIA